MEIRWHSRDDCSRPATRPIRRCFCSRTRERVESWPTFQSSDLWIGCSTTTPNIRTFFCYLAYCNTRLRHSSWTKMWKDCFIFIIHFPFLERFRVKNNLTLRCAMSQAVVMSESSPYKLMELSISDRIFSSTWFRYTKASTPAAIRTNKIIKRITKNAISKQRISL